uniref:Uncharacterized protein n=1 Tax=viral metagenome TaxID=1070528 RepID=A0A6H1ZQJ4_9ZZZZ
MTILKIGIGKTYNIGNYQSLRLDVGIEAEFDYAGVLIDDLEFADIYKRTKELLSKMEKDQGVS